eukprot:2203816-Amphidinium_carterae.1
MISSWGQNVDEKDVCRGKMCNGTTLAQADLVTVRGCSSLDLGPFLLVVGVPTLEFDSSFDLPSTEVGFASGEWVGVQLDTPTGMHDGSVFSITYFSCPPKT